MRRYAVWLLCALLASEMLGHGQERDAISPAVDAVVAGHVAKGRARAGALVVVAGDRIVFARGYGEADPGVTIDPNATLFRIASVSKLFVATAAASLAEAGQLDLGADIRQYLPDVSLRNPFTSPVTTAQLLTHTSGIADSFLHALARDPRELLPLREFFRRFPPEVVQEPGAGLAYSNLGMALAGAVVEAVSGQPFDDFADTHLLGPLGMAHSSFRQPPPAPLASAMAGGRGPRQPPIIRPYAAGALVATPADMGRFLIAELNDGRVDGREALPSRAVRLTQTRHFGDPRAQGVGYGFFESTTGAQRALFHTGDSGHHGLLWMVPDRRLGLFVVYVTSDEGALAMREEVVRAALDVLGGTRESRPARESDTDLAAYGGWYTSNGVPRRTFEHIRGLIGQVHISAVDRTTMRIRPPGGAPAITATRVDTDLFTTSEGGILAFERDRNGRPSRFTMTGSIWDPQGFHAAGWADAQPVTLAVFLVAAICLIARFAITVSRLRRRGAFRDVTSNAVSRVGWRLSGILPFLLLAVPMTALAGILVSPPPYVAMPPGILLAFGILTLAAATGAVLPIAAVAAARERSWPRAQRWFFGVFAGAMLALAWALQHWSLVLRRW